MSRLSVFRLMPSLAENQSWWSRLRGWVVSQGKSIWPAYLFTLAVFGLDCLLPANGAIAMLYVMAPALTLGSDRPKAQTKIGLFAVFLTLAGLIWHMAGPVPLSRAFLKQDVLERCTAAIAVTLICWVGRHLARVGETLEQLRVETSLRKVSDEAAAYFRMLVEHVPIGISQTDVNGRVVFINTEFCRLWHRSADELLGKLTADIVPPAHRDKTRDDEQAVATQRISVERIESIVRDDGEQFLKVIRTPITDSHGELLGVHSVWLDVSELKHAEQTLSRYAENLERSNVDLKQFAYVASHDLQEPLRAVSSYCQLLEKHYVEVLDVRGLRWFQFVARGAQRMQMLVQDLLVYARIDNRAAEWEMVSSRTSCMKAVENLQPRLKEAGATILVGDMPTVLADGSQLELLFQNLIGNAVKFRRPDVPPEVYVSARRIKEGWRFTVRDNGIGIKPEFQDRVFDIFQRLHSHDQYPGTGIGLAICKRIVERYNGRIWVRSHPGEGSKFYFVLPIPRLSPTADIDLVRQDENS